MNLHNVKEIRRTEKVDDGYSYESKQDYENSSCEHR